MTQRHAVLITCTHYYDNRLFLPDRYLRSQGFATTYITSDFEHATKRRYRIHQPDSLQIHVRSYGKNLSLGRILSHRDLARGVYRYLESLPEKPALVWSIVPPNFMAKYLKKYKRRHPGVKLIFDLYDLWPESFPSGSLKKLGAPAFEVWASLRDRSLPAADCILTECDLYQERLGLTGRDNVHTFRLVGNRPELDLTAHLPSDRLNICYLGSINNIIDIPAITRFIDELAALKPVTVQVVGKGEQQEALLEALRATRAEICFHGPVFDQEKKRDILCSCHFGLNIMKPTVCVGLTMKSVDYFSHDLPLINSIPADTWRMVESYRAGVNLGPDAARQVAALTGEELLAMRSNVHRLYEEYFDQAVLQSTIDGILEKLV